MTYENYVRFYYPMPQSGGEPTLQFDWRVPIIPTNDFLSNPEEASKFWARIKGALSKAFKWVAGVARKVVPIASKVIPPPYGTVVTTVNSAIQGIDAVLNMGATTSQANSVLLGQGVQVEDNDGFDVTLQYRIALPDTEAADITKHGVDWIDGETVRVSLNAIDTTQFNLLSYIKDQAPNVWRDLQIYRSSYTGNDESKVIYQTRAKVVFQKKMTQEQAEGFRATLRLGSSIAPAFEPQEEILNYEE